VKSKWHNLTDFKNHLTRNNLETIVSFNGHTLQTDKSVYMLCDEKLSTHPLPKKEKKVESKTVTRRFDGPATNKERVGTHGRGDHAKPDRKKASKVRASKVPKKVSRRSKSPK